MASKKKAKKKAKRKPKAQRSGSFESDAKGPDRDDKGRLLPGHSIPGPGRPKGSIDFMATVSKLADEEGKDLRELVWSMSKAMIAKAMRGDPTSAKLMLDRMCGTDKDSPTFAVHVNSHMAGPPVPDNVDMHAYARNLWDVASTLTSPSDDGEPQTNGRASTNGKDE